MSKTDNGALTVVIYLVVLTASNFEMRTNLVSRGLPQNASWLVTMT